MIGSPAARRIEAARRLMVEALGTPLEGDAKRYFAGIVAAVKLEAAA